MFLHGEFCGGPVVGTHRYHCQSPGLIPGWETKILQTAPHAKKKKSSCMYIILAEIHGYFLFFGSFCEWDLFHMYIYDVNIYLLIYK